MNPEEIVQIGPYPVRRFIAQGGMAWVFEVSDPRFGNARRALKMLKPGVARGDLFRRFEVEAHRLAALEHPNLLTIYDFGVDQATGCHYYTMTLIDTPPLSERGVLSIEEAAPIFLDVLAGLAKLHENNIIHRDIKPSNILIHRDGRAVLADLGIARTAEVAEGETWYSESPGGGTATGVAIGTPAYMSPEQARARRNIGKQTDVFSFGLTMYRVLTGRIVYDEIEEIDSTSGQDILAYLGHLSIARAEFDFEFEREIPEPIREVIRSACRIDPGARPPDAAALRLDLLDALQGVDSRMPPEPTRSVIPLRAIAGAAAVLVTLAVGIWLWPGPDGARVSPEEVARIGDESEAVLDASRALGASAEDLQEAAAKRSQAVTLLGLGREAEERGDTRGSEVYLRDAREDFAKACELVASGFLQPSYDGEREALAAQASGLEAAGAAELRAEAWSSLASAVAGLDAPLAAEGPCASADALRGRLEALRAVVADARALEQALEREWPRLAEEARAEAIEAEGAVATIYVDAPEFMASIERGRNAIGEGDAARTAASYLAARDAYGVARDAFRQAGDVAAAVRARDDAGALRAEAAAHRIEDPAGEERVAAADALFAEGRWQEAAARYEQAAKWLRIGIERSKELQPVREAESSARSARQAAEAAGAQRSAAEAFGLAEQSFAQAEKLVAAERLEEARAGFEAARVAFEKAVATAGEEIEQAKQVGVQARALLARLAAGTDCAQAQPLTQAECKRGSRELEHGDEALASRDPHTALAAYGSAREALEHALEIGERLGPVERGKVAAERARAEAERAGAARAAPSEAAAAEARWTAGLRAFDAARLDEAERAFADARAGFEAAEAKAEQALASARDAAESARAAQRAAEAACKSAPAADCESGVEAIAAGDAALDRGDAEAAAAAYGSAREAFSRARAVAERRAPVERERLAAEQSRAAAERAGAAKTASEAFAAAGARESEAKSALAAGRFEEAQRAFGEARAGFDSAREQASAAIGRADSAATAARAAQQAAAKACDPKLAVDPEACARGRAELSGGDAALEKGELDAALRAYSAAEGVFEAVKEAGERRASAQDARAAAATARTAVRGSAARLPADELAGAEARWQEGDRLYEARKFEEARRTFEESRTAFARLAERIEAEQPRPPQITRSSPGQSKLTARRGEQIRFEVSARDPNPDDVLRYVWTVDGREQPAKGPTLDLEVARDASVAVRVEDRGGLHSSASWKLTVGGGAPTLSLSPAGRGDLRLAVGEGIQLRASAKDPEGEAVETSFLIDGKVVGTGDTFTFRAEQPGTRRLEVRARDASGSVASLQRKIVVVAPEKENAPPRLVSRSPTDALVKAAHDEDLAFSVKAEDPEAGELSYRWTVDGRPVASSGARLALPGDRSGEVRVEVKDAGGASLSAHWTVQRDTPSRVDAGAVVSATLGEYRAAYEARDIGRLAGIWQMSSSQRSNLAEFFRSTDKLSMSLEPGEARLEGDRISVPFDQRIRASGVPEARASYVAVLVQASPERWQIKTLTRR